VLKNSQRRDAPEIRGTGSAKSSVNRVPAIQQEIGQVRAILPCTNSYEREFAFMDSRLFSRLSG
jgi:hypothetical protein